MGLFSVEQKPKKEQKSYRVDTTVSEIPKSNTYQEEQKVQEPIISPDESYSAEAF
jgi:hypothetical protein